MKMMRSILSSKFIYSDDVADVIDLAIRSNKNVILHGPAGHGKSEMVMAAMEGLKIRDKCFVQFFGEGMDEARLFGGLNFKKLEDEKVLELHTDRSFLNSQVAVFEELFDAPPVVLLSLKDTLTARELRNGAQRIPMQTRCIIALTNRSPAEISEIGPAAHALVERFPLQLEVKWKRYTSEDYQALFRKVKPQVPLSLAAALATACSRVAESGGFISPRTAIHALEVCVIGMNGSKTATADSFRNLRFIPEFEATADSIAAEFQAAEAFNQASKALKAFRSLYSELAAKVDRVKTTGRCLDIVKQLEGLNESVTNFPSPDGLLEDRSGLLSNIRVVISKATRKAIDLS